MNKLVYHSDYGAGVYMTFTICKLFSENHRIETKYREAAAKDIKGCYDYLKSVTKLGVVWSYNSSSNVYKIKYTVCSDLVKEYSENLANSLTKFKKIADPDTTIDFFEFDKNFVLAKFEDMIKKVPPYVLDYVFHNQTSFRELLQVLPYRTDPYLIEIVEKYYNDNYSNGLKVHETNEDCVYVSDYDGKETVHSMGYIDGEVITFTTKHSSLNGIVCDIQSSNLFETLKDTAINADKSKLENFVPATIFIDKLVELFGSDNIIIQEDKIFDSDEDFTFYRIICICFYGKYLATTKCYVSSKNTYEKEMSDLYNNLIKSLEEK